MPAADSAPALPLLPLPPLPTGAALQELLADPGTRRGLAVIHRRGDQLLTGLLLAHMALALWLATFYGTWLVTLVVGPCALLSFLGSRWLLPESRFTRSMAGVALQMFVALHIYQLHGMAEQHFFFFTAWTAMVVYQDWVCMWPGTLLIIAQHILFAVLHNAGAELYFFEDAYVGFRKLSFHFGIALFHVGLCGVWAWILNRSTLRAMQQEKQLAAARLTAERAKEARGEFLATVSHEVRTPLTGMLGMAQLLQDSPLDTEQHENVATLLASGRALLAVLDDVLDFAKIEAGRLQVTRAPCDLLAVAEDAVELMAARAGERGVELALAWQADVPQHVVTDGNRVRQILLNLIGNALKFTTAGHVCLRVAGGAATGLVIDVEDTGSGVPEAARDRLFRKFEQARQTGPGSTGLGLAISRQLAELLGGTLDLLQSSAAGSTFRLCLPLAVAAVAVEPAAPPLVSTRVLLLGRGLGADAVAAALAAAGARCARAADPETAVAQLRAEEFDVAVLHEVTDEAAAATALRAVRPTPLLAVRNLRTLTAALPFGVAAAIRAPSRRAALVHAVANLLPGHHPAPAAAATAVDAPLHLHVLVVDDSPLNLRVVVAMLTRCGCRVRTAGSGAAALAAFAEQAFDVVLMDCRMPEMDGFEATRRIRAIEGGSRHTPVIALTADAMAGVRDGCLLAGMDEYLAKPVDRAALVAMLRAVTGTRSSQTTPV